MDNACGGYPNHEVHADRLGAAAALGQACAMEVNDARARLIRLQAERFGALEFGVASPSPYMDRLQAAIADARHDYVTAAVLEIAVLRGALAGAMRG